MKVIQTALFKDFETDYEELQKKINKNLAKKRRRGW